MTRFFKALLVFIATAICGGNALAQIINDAAKWEVEAHKRQGNEYDIVFKLKLKKNWHIWSLKPGGDGLQMPPEFQFDNNRNVKFNGAVTEHGHPVTGLMDGVDGQVTYFHDAVEYRQKATIAKNTKVRGMYTYQVCDDQMCLPPKTVPFTVAIKDAGGEEEPDTEDSTANAASVAPADSASENADSTAMATITDAISDSSKNTSALGGNGTDSDKKESGNKSLLWLFLAALGGGFAAVITPCVYSMIPITVSFFTKRSKTRKEGIRNALYYSLSIIIIFTVLGVAISAIFGANALNSLSTNWIANLFFFAIFVLFGISFLGAFEIALPSSWTSKTDSRAGVGSFGGIFFMALTLAIVSFSCTGPIVGPLLVLAGQGGIAGPAVGMFGFSIGLSLPFTLFAIFPGLLNKMASSGGWLNQVKVVLGFLELMLAMKFLSNADLAMGWRLLDREIFIASWIVLSVLLGFYVLGKLKLSHDDAPAKNIYGQEYVSIFKLFIAIISFTFAAYLLPGMWGAPLNGMSAFLPPMGTFDSFGGGGETAHADNLGGIKPVKYAEDMKIYEPPVVKSLGLVTFFDYDEAIEASRKLKRPLMLDFTGINCVNCRKMESQVWSNPEVARRLKEDFVVASLYVDFTKIKLPKDQQYFSKDLNSQVVSVGNKNADLQASKFGANSQPFYFYVDEKGVKLADNGYGYDPDIEKFVAHLESVKAKYKELHP